MPAERSVGPPCYFRLTVAFDARQGAALQVGLPADSVSSAPSEAGIWRCGNTLMITSTQVKSALRQATRDFRLPEVDFGEFTASARRRSLVLASELIAEVASEQGSRDLDDVVFTGDLHVVRGGTLQHPTWRFLLTEGLPRWLTLRTGIEPRRFVLSREHAREETFVRSRVLRVTRHAARELLRIVSDDPEQLLEVEHRDLERIMALAAEDLGFDVELTRGSKDGGRDLVLRCRDDAGRARCIYAEVKHWVSGKKVGHRELRDLLTVVARDGADGAVLVSTSGFTAAAMQLVGNALRR